VANATSSEIAAVPVAVHDCVTAPATRVARARRRRPATQLATIGRYELIVELARGGMGAVYLCRHAGEAGFQRLYALKLIHEHLARDPGFVAMFLDEARIAATMHHHNVVSALELGSMDGRHFVVMEYVEGATLSALLDRNRTWRPPELLVPLIIDLLNGLDAAHGARDANGRPLQLVHRDVSPANVLVGVDGAARLSDFGIAKARARLTATQPGVLKGRLAYAAPEQVRGDAQIDRRADVWAAGVLLWKALSGKSPFLAESDEQTIDNVLHLPVPPPSHVGLQPPSVFDAVCLTALSRNPAHRYPSAAAMADELRRVAGENQMLGPPRDIGAWVAASVAGELAQRRAAVRAALDARPRPARRRITRLTQLPSVPGVEPAATRPAARDAGCDRARTVPVRRRALLRALSSRWWLALGVAVVAGALVGGALGAWLSTTRAGDGPRPLPAASQGAGSDAAPAGVGGPASPPTSEEAARATSGSAGAPGERSRVGWEHGHQ
jgi:serine/threonine-protein kinase